MSPTRCKREQQGANACHCPLCGRILGGDAERARLIGGLMPEGLSTMPSNNVKRYVARSFRRQNLRRETRST